MHTHQLVRAKRLELDRIRVGFCGQVDHFPGQVELTLVIVADFGNDQGPLVNADMSDFHGDRKLGSEGSSS